MDPQSNLAFAIIPGIAFDDAGQGHAFIQYIDGVACTSQYFSFAIDTFASDAEEFRVSVDSNTFSQNQIQVNIMDLEIDVRIEGWTPFPKKLFRPGIMGWYTYIPMMQCYHGLGSMQHSISGNISIGSKTHSIRKATGYVEKDWGRSFPKSWIWCQCNTFDNEEDLSVFASIAHIPWLGSHFIGFLAVIYYQSEHHVFATYTGAKRTTDIHTSGVSITFSDRTRRLEIVALAGAGSDLRSPISGNMTGKVNESLNSTVDIMYTHRNQTFHSKGQYCGLEVAGPVEILSCPARS